MISGRCGFQGLFPVLLLAICDVENQLDGLFGTGGGADNHSLVVLQNAEPGLNISGGVFEAGRRFKAQFMQAAGGADFRDKLLFAVRFGAESGGGSVPGETV